MEHYVLAIDGVEVTDCASRRAEVLQLALTHLEGGGHAVEVAIADARTLHVCAWWSRDAGKPWRLRGSLVGWLH